jgi:hypothetical protein
VCPSADPKIDTAATPPGSSSLSVTDSVETVTGPPKPSLTYIPPKFGELQLKHEGFGGPGGNRTLVRNREDDLSSHERYTPHFWGNLMRETLASEPLINFGAGSFRNLHGLTRICGHSVNVFIVVCVAHLVPCSVPNLLWVQPKPRPLCVEGTSVWATLRFELNLLCVWPTLGFPCTGQPRSPCSQRLSAPALTSPAGISTRRPLPIRTQTRLLRVFATVDRNRKAIVRCAFHYFQRESGIVGIG